MLNMPRVEHSVEEIRQRNRDAQRKYRETHSEELKARRAMGGDNTKRREDMRAHIAKLVYAGVFVPLKPGRKRLYTPEEALEVAKRQ